MAKIKSKKDELVAAIRRMGETHDVFHVFNTMLELAATSLSACTDPEHHEEREKAYKALEAKLTPEELNDYAHLTALLYQAIRERMDDPGDVLGEIFHILSLHNKWKGQFFTPDPICRFMAQVTVGNSLGDREEYPVLINEPACRSGAIVLGAVWSMMQEDFDFRHKAFFIAEDIDIRCVWMAYLQLSLYEIPAVVVHGNSLSLEEWSHWPTPMAPVPFQSNSHAEGSISNDNAV